jgi:hypothetical protein
MGEPWNYVQNGKPQGPVAEEELKRLIAAGQMQRECLVWRPGMPDWLKASQVPGLLPVPDLPPPPVPEQRSPFEPPQAVVLSIPEPSSLQAQAAVAGALEALRATKPWARFMGVLGILGVSVTVLGAILMATLSRGPFKGLPAPLRVVLPLAYLLLGAFQIPPVVYLNRYASRIGVLLESHAPEDLARALDAQKAFWKYLGIFALVMLCLYALLFLFGATMAALAHGGRRF